MLQNSEIYPTNETGGKVLETPNRPDRNLICVRRSRMAADANIGLRGDSASEQSENWKSIAELARKLAEKQGGAK